MTGYSRVWLAIVAISAAATLSGCAVGTPETASPPDAVVEDAWDAWADEQLAKDRAACEGFKADRAKQEKGLPAEVTPELFISLVAPLVLDASDRAYEAAEGGQVQAALFDFAADTAYMLDMLNANGTPSTQQVLLFQNAFNAVEQACGY